MRYFPDGPLTPGWPTTFTLSGYVPAVRALLL
jgi:hypothetical protein